MRKWLAVLAILSSAAIGQAPPSASGGPEIIVEGHQLHRSDIAKAIGSISNPESTGGFESQYPRWADRVCVLVAGFPRDGAQLIADRIGEVARDLALDAGQPGCSPNIFVFATGDPAKLIGTLRLKRRGLVTGSDVAVVRRIQDSHDPVRWLGATTFTGGSGEPPQPGDTGSSGKATPVVNSYDGGSRLAARTRTVLARETIVIDDRQIGGISYGQLADYLSFVALAQLSPHASPEGVSSILSLFAKGTAAPAGLTAFDRAYLKGLYQSPAGVVGAIQKSVIAGTIDRTLRPKQPHADDRQAPPDGR